MQIYGIFFKPPNVFSYFCDFVPPYPRITHPPCSRPLSLACAAGKQYFCGMEQEYRDVEGIVDPRLMKHVETHPFIIKRDSNGVLVGRIIYDMNDPLLNDAKSWGI